MSFGQEISGNYEEKSDAVPNGASDYSWKANVAGAFSKVERAKSATIRSDQTLTIKFNRANEDGILVSAAEFPLAINDILIEDILISNASGVVANVRILLR